VELAKAIIREHRPSGDIYVFPLLLALTIGRVGCFSMGIAENTFGYPTTFPFGIDLGDGLMRHPLMLYEIGFLAIIWLFLCIFRTRISQVPGLSFKILIINYLIFRFFIEFLKPDINVLWGLSTLQIFCLVGLISYLPWFLQQVYPNARKGLHVF
jgi:prolipoprotein diacylglyceryltransferase